MTCFHSESTFKRMTRNDIIGMGLLPSHLSKVNKLIPIDVICRNAALPKS